MKTKVFLIIITGIAFLLAIRCEKEEIVRLPVLSTTTVTDITTTTAKSGGTLTFVGREEIFSNGVCWNTKGNPSTTDSKTIDGKGNPQFVSSIIGLSAGTTYYVRAYGTNSAGIAYGDELTFTTLGSLPAATTQQAINLSPTGATLTGTVNANELSTIVTFEYGPSASYGQEVTAEQSPVTGNTSTEVNATLTGLTFGTYHFRVKAINSLGTYYGSDIEFIICNNVPTVTTLAATIISPTSVTLNGTVNANGSSTIVTFEYNIYKCGRWGCGWTWNTITATQSPITGTTLTNVSAFVTGLKSGITHPFRVKAENSCGTVVYGDTITFITPPPCDQVPIAVTSAATSISSTGATLNGTVNANGSSTIVTFEYGTYGPRGGVFWKTVTATQGPITGTTLTNVSAVVTDLKSGTTHPFRVKAENFCGTVYGENLSFTLH